MKIIRSAQKTNKKTYQVRIPLAGDIVTGFVFLKTKRDGEILYRANHHHKASKLKNKITSSTFKGTRTRDR